MKVKISSKSSLVVVEILWDVPQVIGPLLLVLRKERDIYTYIYLEVSAKQR